MKCVRPILIPRPGLLDKPMSLLRGQKPSLRADYLVVPCGKCINCVKVRQDNFACRIRSEAERKGTMALLTLTYREDSLPLVSTIWRASKETGEMERITDPDFVCYSRKEDFFGYREEIAKIEPSRFPRYIDIPCGLEDDDYDYIYRITPSVCRKDVQSWLKQCRYYLKKERLDVDFTYAICSEFGPRTCRPHYHVCIFGLTSELVEIFSGLWSFGHVDFKVVNRINPDGTDGFARVSEYVGKYVSKGVFECDSVKCGAAKNCRMMSSKNLGAQIIEKFRPYVLAYDVIGAPYDIDTFFIPSKQRYLTRVELVNLTMSIPKRLSITFDGKRYFAFPRVFRNKIFYVEKKSEQGNVTYRRPSKLWKMVVDAIQQQYADLHQSEFREFLSRFDARKVRQAVSSFNEMQENASELAQSFGVAHYKNQLTKSIF